MLDGLDRPLQVVLRFVPGGGSQPSHPTPGRPISMRERRQADLAYAAEVRRSPTAVRREVVLAVADARVESLATALRALGLPAVTRAPELTAGELEDLTSFQAEKPDHLQSPGGWMRFWYLDRFPGVELEPGWLGRLAPPGFETEISWHAEPLPTEWVVDFLQRRLVAMRAARMVEFEGGAQDPQLAGALPSAQELQRSLSASEERAFHVSLYIGVRCRTRGDLETASVAVDAAARSALCRVLPCVFRMYDGRLATLPIGVDRLRRVRVLHTSALVTLFPWLDSDLDQRAGLYVGRSRATGSPVLVDPFDDNRYPNANIGVFGHSGAGKTHLLSTLAMGLHGTGAQVLVIDPEHEYGHLAAALGGVGIRLALGAGHAINVLDLRPAAARDESWLGPAAADAVDLTAAICGGLDEPERALMEEAVRAAFTQLDTPLLGDVAVRLPAASRVRRILDRWVAGSLGAIFSAPTNVDLEAPIVVFGMRELREELVAPVHFLLAEALWSRIKERRRRRVLLVDELGLLFEDAVIRRFVVNLARRIRKYDGALIFATQNPGDLLGSEQGSVVATNPALHFFGAQRPGEAIKLQRAFQLSDRQRERLETARRGEFLLAAGSDRIPLLVEAPPWQTDVIRGGRPPPTPSV